MRRHGAIIALVAVLATAGAEAAEWGGIVPGQTTQTALSARYGAPSQTSTQKVEGHDTARWTYEGPRAPRGVRRLVVDFGLLTPSGFRQELVRDFRLEPSPGVFNRAIVLHGWGAPQGKKTEGTMELFYYQEGLIVYFPRDGDDATLLLFGPPQPPLPAPTAPR